MRAYLVHHADAVGADVDAQRPLSAEGRAQAEQVAQFAREQGARPDVIWHSGKLRARQTAETLYRVCNPFAEFRMVRGLRPDDSPQEIQIALQAETREVLLVSHMPFLPTLAVRLAPAALSSFPVHGIVALERATEDAEWIVLWRYTPS